MDTAPLESSGETPKPRSGLRRLTKIALRVILIAYLGLCIVLAVFQTQMIFPGSASQGRKDSIVRPFAGAELVELKTKDGEKVAALFGGATTINNQPLSDAKSRPTLLYFYGNGMCMADCEGEFLHFRQRGFNVLIPDYLGYGMSSGKPSEQGVYATADAAYEHLAQRPDIDASKIIPFGWSLGGAAAIHIASSESFGHKVPCLVTVSAFTSMGDMAHHLFPYVPAKLFLKHHFENEQKLRTIHAPIFIAHGAQDDMIPFEMSNKLAAAAGGKVTKYDVNEGKHNDVFDVGGVEMLDAITAFVKANAGP